VTVESKEEAVALYALGVLKVEELPDIAVLLMEQGVDLPCVAALAGAVPADSPGDRWDLFTEALRLMKCELPDKLSAAHVLKRTYAKRGCASTGAARDAASKIMNLYYAIYELLPASATTLAGESFGIHRLLGAYYSFDDVPMDDLAAIRELEQELQAACEEIATRGV
jgi:hypothetical protein